MGFPSMRFPIWGFPIGGFPIEGFQMGFATEIYLCGFSTGKYIFLSFLPVMAGPWQLISTLPPISGLSLPIAFFLSSFFLLQVVFSSSMPFFLKQIILFAL